MNTTIIVIQIISAIMGSIGFAMVFNLKRDKFPYIVIGSFISISLDIVILYLTKNTFVSCLVAAFVSMTLAEIYARWRKAPATLFIIIHIIPLVPGGSLYYAMRGVVNDNFLVFREHATDTVLAAVGIALGIISVTAIKHLLFKRE